MPFEIPMQEHPMKMMKVKKNKKSVEEERRNPEPIVFKNYITPSK
jgi:hypothetical protein